MIIFETLRYRNFLSTGNVFTEIPLNKHANTLIVGKNGAGKSTILDVLCFALFGKPFRSINKPQLVNTITKKGLLVELEFSIGSARYLIKRGIKPAVFEVCKNGTLISQDADSKDYQEVLEKQILKLNYKSFRQIVILGSASFVPFMALTTGQRREIIEDLLDLQIFTTMNVLLKERIANNTKLILEINAKQELIKEKINIYNKHMAQVKQDNEDVIVAKQELIDEAIKELEALKANSDTLQKEIDELTVLFNGHEDHTKRIAKLEKMIDKAQYEINFLTADIKFFTEHEDCPACRQGLEESYRKKALDKRQKKIQKYNTGIKDLLAEKAELELKQFAKDTIGKQIGKAEYDQNHIFAEARSKAAYIAILQKEIDATKTKITEYHGERIEELQNELLQAEEAYKEALDDKQTFTAASGLLKDNGIKAKIIKQYVPVINKLINKYLSALDFFVEFELDENFNETIKSRYRDEFSYESFSEGEKKRINLAIIFTWRAIAKLRNSANTNLFLLDEVFDSSLDLSGMEEVLKVLLSLSAENTFIISHNQAFVSDKFEHTIKFEKKQNFSRMITV
jgi:DNA repair exonuclease SbcCD ATPase subunit